MSKIKFLLVTRKHSLIYLPGFIQVYKEVFAGPPYFEVYSDDQVEQTVWHNHLTKGCIFLALDKTKVVGLGCSIPLNNIKPGEPNRDVYDFLSEAPNLPFSLGDTCYMSEVAVLLDYRNQGIGRELVRRRLSWAKKQGINNYVMRTASEGSNSLGIYLKLGAKEINGLKQDISEVGIESASKYRIYLYGMIN